jgi:hypothetical protein
MKVKGGGRVKRKLIFKIAAGDLMRFDGVGKRQAQGLRNDRSAGAQGPQERLGQKGVGRLCFLFSHLLLPCNFVSAGTVALGGSSCLLPNVGWTRLPWGQASATAQNAS